MWILGSSSIMYFNPFSLIHQIIRVNIMDLGATMISSHKDLLLHKLRRRLISHLSPPLGHQEHHLGAWTTLYLDTILPVRLSVSQILCPIHQETHPALNLTFLAHCTPCQQKSLAQLPRFPRYPSTVVLIMGIICRIRLKWTRQLYGSFKLQDWAQK